MHNKIKSKIGLPLLLCLLIGPLMVSAAAQADDLEWKGPENCQFQAPKTLEANIIEWVGACADNKADGIGMLKPRGEDSSEATFYGKLAQGKPVTGVIEVTGGFKAGRFDGSDIRTAEHMDERDEAFETAAEAADEVSQHYLKNGNQASSKYYKKKSEFLLLQIE